MSKQKKTALQSRYGLLQVIRFADHFRHPQADNTNIPIKKIVIFGQMMI